MLGCMILGVCVIFLVIFKIIKIMIKSQRFAVLDRDAQLVLD